ncbi:hypothetical protein MHBO_005130 [Bonamia ostreae]|uniref:Uncharacterized protein n=1 Tax=Bonamia ostreae TaxID=126728 RepID=A0ABV2AV66_9EUKA
MFKIRNLVKAAKVCNYTVFKHKKFCTAKIDQKVAKKQEKTPFAIKLGFFFAGGALMSIVGYYQLAVDLTGLSRQIHQRLNDLSSSVQSMADASAQEMEEINRRIEVLENLNKSTETEKLKERRKD